MADRPDEFEDLDGVEDGPADEGRVLAPEELDITESEHVEELEEGRFVVSPDGPPSVGPEHRAEASAREGAGRDSPRADDDPAEFTQQSEPRQSRESRSRGPPTEGSAERNDRGSPERAGGAGRERGSTRREPAAAGLTQEAVHRWLRESFAEGTSQYGFDVTATFEGSVSQRRMASNDVVTIFESLILWYAQQVDTDTPVEEILGILLAESNVPIRYPPESIHRLVRSSDLTPEDSIADLLAEIDDGVQL